MPWTTRRFEEIVGTKYFLFNRGSGDVKYMNHNRLLFCFTPSVGGKTGYTRASRHCYVGAFEKDGKTYILSILGSRNLWGDAVNVLQQIYPEVPSPRDISLARASNISLARESRESTVSLTRASAVSLSSYHVRTVSYTRVKKHETRKRGKRVRRGRHVRLHRV